MSYETDLPRYSNGWMEGPLPGGSAGSPVCRLAPGPGGQAASHQRLGRQGDDPGRLSAIHPARGVGCSATFFCPSGKTKSDSRLFRGREFDFVLHPPAFSGACSAFEQRAGKRLSPGFGKVQGNQEQSAARAALASDRTGMLLTPCFFLSSLSFSRFNLSRFDEPTQAEVTMTESHTPWAASASIDRIPRFGRHNSLDMPGS